MKKVLGSVMVVFVLCSVSAQAGLLEWSDGFEDGLGNWAVNGAVQRYSTWAYEGDYTAYTYAQNGKSMIRGITDGNGGVDEQFVVEFAFMTSSATSPYCHQDIFISNASNWYYGVAQAGVMIHNLADESQSQVSAWGGSTSVILSNATWYTVKLVINPDAENGGTYDWYLDGTLQESGLAFYTSSTSLPQYLVNSHNYSDGSFYVDIDAVSVAVPEPATMVCLGSGAIFALIRRRKK